MNPPFFKPKMRGQWDGSVIGMDWWSRFARRSTVQGVGGLGTMSTRTGNVFRFVGGGVAGIGEGWAVSSLCAEWELVLGVDEDWFSVGGGVDLVLVLGWLMVEDVVD
jgi:hypothetical protein